MKKCKLLMEDRLLIDPDSDPNAPSDDDKIEDLLQRAATLSSENRRKKSKSMHDGIAVWCDCCSCEAEPYWVDIAEQMGIDLGSDYEEGDAEHGNIMHRSDHQK